MLQRSILLYGPPGSGKSRVGRVLAEALSLPFYDLDREIETRCGRSIPDIFQLEGEPGFREHERGVFAEVLENGMAVIALGGGTLTDAGSYQAAQRQGTVVCLDARLDVLAQRLQTDGNQRPLLAGGLEENLAALLAKRAAHYAQFSPAIDTTLLDPQQATGEIQILLGFFRVDGMGPGYNINILPGGLQHLDQALGSIAVRGPLAMVSDETVGSLYLPMARSQLEKAGYTAGEAVFPAGEASKSIDTVVGLWRRFLELGIERTSSVIALGGGVTTDIAGFAAATYLRGVTWVCAPTSLLGMVDAGLGGKTGIDLPEGKNLAGAFHAPALVWIDPQALESLPLPEVRNGMAEVVKHGAIGDAALFAVCASGLPETQVDWKSLVSRAVGVKAAILRADPYEQGVRAALNLGHTIGHGIEAASHYRLRHGEAVSIGMAAETHLAERLGIADPGLTDTIRDVLVKLGLPVRLPSGLDPKEILAAMLHDKKKRDGMLRFALPVRIGEVQVGVGVEIKEVEFVLQL